MKPLLTAALFALAALGWPAVSSAQQRLPLRITAYDTHSGIMVTQFRFLRVKDTHHASASGNTVVISSQGTAISACVSFENTLPRSVTQVDFHFVFYDRLRNHAGDAELVAPARFPQHADRSRFRQPERDGRHEGLRAAAVSRSAARAGVRVREVGDVRRRLAMGHVGSRRRTNTSNRTRTPC